MLKKILAMFLVLTVICGLSTCALASGGLYEEWNEYVDRNLWGDAYKTPLDPDGMAASLQRAQVSTSSTDDGVKMGPIGKALGASKTNAADWLRAIANNIAEYYEPDSVLCYLADQKIDDAGTKFLASELNAWKDNSVTVNDELYKLRVSVNSGSDVYEIMVLVVSDVWTEFVESVLIKHTGNGTSTASVSNSYADAYSDLPPLYVVNCKEWISIWSEPSNMSTRLDTLPKGTRVDNWMPYNDDFVYIDLGGDGGFLSWDYLSYNK